MLEIIRDRQNSDSQRVVYFSAGYEFNPMGIYSTNPQIREKARGAHLTEFYKR